MNIKLSEMDDSNIQNYWEKPFIEKPKKKKINFDDILSNMNLSVNKDGVLQYMSFANKEEDQSNQVYPQQNYVNNQNIQMQNQYKNQAKFNNEKVDPNVKHSYIYNKYFKDYKDNFSNEEKPVRIIRTPEEYRRFIIEERIKALQERNRIAQIKSKKMLYTNTTVKASKNSLHKMSFN